MLKSNWLGQQREQWLLIQAPRVIKCRSRVARATFSGVRVGDLPWDQKQLVEFVVKTNRVPYRSEEVDKSMSILKSNGRLDELRMAFYQQEDPGNDKVWDIWRIEGPSFMFPARHTSTLTSISASNRNLEAVSRWHSVTVASNE